MEESIFAYSFPYFRAWQTSPVTFLLGSEKNSINCSASFQLFLYHVGLCWRHKFLKNGQKIIEMKYIAYIFSYHRVWLYPITTFGLQNSFTERLCKFWVSFCSTYDFVGNTSFTKNKISVKKTFGQLFHYHRVWQTSRNIFLSVTELSGGKCASFSIISVTPK